MLTNKRATSVVITILTLTLGGCGGNEPIREIMEGRKVEYERDEYQARKELQYPPDIITATQAEYAGSQLLSEYSIASVPEVGTVADVELGDARQVVYRRDGNLRWVEVDLPVDDTWILAQQFWLDTGFTPEKEEPQLGVIETAWLDLRQAPLGPGLTGVLDDVLDRVLDSGERDKFVSNIEAVNDEKSALYISHRHLGAVFKTDGQFEGFKPLPPDPLLEIEMLRRFMLFAAQTPEAQQEDTFVEEVAEAEAEEEKDYILEDDRLLIKKPLDESWLLVRIGLDRGGFTIEDRDNSARIYYIQHSGGPESQQIFSKVEKGFFNQIFAEEQPILRDLKMTLVAGEEEGEDATVVQVESADEGEPLTESQAAVLLELLSVNLP